ncbi:hypothetical protein E6C55_30085 [Cohnella fermenti]|uniref:Uncharacterized protein n=1 Tax=Cohnella fermenti TaxID=2565925 RepID=A0A4S4BGC7_9BACL|nr:hypothetical protein E6C55_30085 [Cohnella fermenti]
MNKKSDPASLRSPYMGEEKPDEELMGKRKSSPRLSPAFLRRRYYQCDPIAQKYTPPEAKKCGTFATASGVFAFEAAANMVT